MSHEDEDDKPTVVLDLNALKKQKLKQEEDLANIASELEFNVGEDSPKAAIAPKPRPQPKKPAQPQSSAPKIIQQPTQTTVVLFDFQSDFFQNSMDQFPKGYNYQIATELSQLNKFLASKTFQIIVFNYDVNAKAVNQLTAQIKQKFPHTKTMIMARAISPEKAKVHAQTPSGATGYYQFPLNSEKIEAEFQKIQATVKKVGYK